MYLTAAITEISENSLIIFCFFSALVCSILQKRKASLSLSLFCSDWFIFIMQGCNNSYRTPWFMSFFCHLAQLLELEWFLWDFDKENLISEVLQFWHTKNTSVHWETVLVLGFSLGAVWNVTSTVAAGRISASSSQIPVWRKLLLAVHILAALGYNEKQCSKQTRHLKKCKHFPCITPKPYLYFLFITSAKQFHESDIQKLQPVCIIWWESQQCYPVLMSCKLLVQHPSLSSTKSTVDPFQAPKNPMNFSNQAQNKGLISYPVS
jgi:hypothetical protein